MANALHARRVWDTATIARFEHLRDIMNDGERYRRHELFETLIAFERQLRVVEFATRDAQARAHALVADVHAWLRTHPMDEFSYRRLKGIYR
jgi:hypothetical protein